MMLEVTFGLDSVMMIFTYDHQNYFLPKLSMLSGISAVTSPPCHPGDPALCLLAGDIQLQTPCRLITVSAALQMPIAQQH